MCGALIRTRRFATFARLQCTHCFPSRVDCSSLHRAGACDRARGIQQRRDPADGGNCTSCTRLVKWTPRVPASPALPALPHTQYTHTQSHNRRHGSRLGAGRRGWDAAEQRSRGRLAAAGRRVRVGEHAGLSGVATPLEPHPSAGGWQQHDVRKSVVWELWSHTWVHPRLK